MLRLATARRNLRLGCIRYSSVKWVHANGAKLSLEKAAEKNDGEDSSSQALGCFSYIEAMEGLYSSALLRNPAYESFTFNERSDKLSVFEIWASHTSYEFSKRQIHDANIRTWLTKKSSDETALLRLVLARADVGVKPWHVDIRKSSLDAVLAAFELMEAYRYVFVGPPKFARVPVHQTQDRNTLVFALCIPEYIALAWRYDAKSRRTEGVCWADTWVFETMQNIMNQQKDWVQHPMFFAYVASVMLGHLLDCSLDRDAEEIAAVENRTRYHGFEYTFGRIAKGDYASLSQSMSGCAVSMAGLERIHKILNQFLDDIPLYSQRHGVNEDLDLGEVNLEMDRCVETLKRGLKMRKIQIDYHSRRIEVQLTAASTAFPPCKNPLRPQVGLTDPLPMQLFNLVAQKEARVGIAVAEDSRTLAYASKEDSTAMKTLAAMTIAFLPGTFVAAFFAMPLFEWDAVDGTSVVSKRFWVYWAVTVPLTFLTFSFWLVWNRRQARVHRVSERRAKEELWDDIENEDGSEVKEKED